MSLPLLLLLLAGCDLLGQSSSASPTATPPALAIATAATLSGSSAPASAPGQASTQAVGSVLTPVPSPTLLPETERLSVFDNVWEIIDQHYLYDDFHGLDWSQLRDQYEPKAMEATTPQQFYDTISSMVQQLNDGHSRYLSPWAAREEDDFVRGSATYVGVGIASVVSENAHTAMYVYPNSPADKAGLKRRDRIIAVDGHPLVNAQNSDPGILGPVFTNVRLTIQSPGQAKRDIVIQRQVVAGKLAASSHVLDVDPTIGYLIVPSFFVGDMDKQVESEITKLRQRSLLHDQPLRGLIIDLRGNGGGWLTMLKSVLGDFMTGNAGSFYTNDPYVQNILDRDHLSNLEITGGSLYNQLRSLPLVVLVDKNSESATEMIAASLQASGRAHIVGTRTAGNTEATFYYKLQDESRLWLAEAGYRTPEDTSLEGTGVLPDVSVDVDWASYPESADPQILKGVEIIHQAGGR